MPKDDIRTIWIYGSRVVPLSDGRVTLLLKTERWGVIPFELTAQTIQTLQRDLAAAERHLGRPIVKA